MRPIALLALLIACTPASAEPRPKVPRPDAIVTAAGDTAKLFASWPIVRAATGYLVTGTVTASNGTWTGIPTNLSQTARTVAITAISTTADSGTFVVCVRAFHASDTSAAGCSAPKVWRRRLVPPTVTIDSVIGFLVKPDTVRLGFGATVAFCPFAVFRGDTVALLARYGADPGCQAEDAKLRAAGRARPRFAQQAVADSLCPVWQATGGTITPDPCEAGGLGGRGRIVVQLAAR